MKQFLSAIIGIFILLLSFLSTSAQILSPLEKKYLNDLRAGFNGDNAYNTVAFVEKFWRLAGNTGFNESIFYVERILQQAGFVKEVNGEKDNMLTYRVEKRPMRRPTWEPVDAQVFIQGEDKPLLAFKTNRNMLASYSTSTGAEGITAELIDIDKGTAKDFEGKEVAGKILLGNGGIGSIYNMAMKRGAIGAFAYSLPAYTQPEKNQNSIQFQSIPYKDSAQGWGIILSYAARQRLKEALAKGKVFVKVITESKIYAAEELTIVANVRGQVNPDERFVFSAHVQEPGANDNASGVGTLAEMARLTADMIRKGKFTPQRSISFLWGDEIVSTARYIKDDSIRAKGIKWGVSLDMVGENTAKTGGTFLIEKMPDPSAIWTRGNEKHTEWGGSVLKEKDMFPHYFNDLLLNRCLNEANGTGWIVNTNPYEGGSDHTPFLQAKIPGLLMWHFTDMFYHTDGDRLDMVSAEEMKHVGISALLTAFLLTSADTKTAISLITDIEQNAAKRLQTEFELSKEAVQKGKGKQDEQHILDVWTDWYTKAISAAADIAVKPDAAAIQKSIDVAVNRVSKLAETLKHSL
ncbi:MAG TPA: M28 family peptidase [Chitinophagaceae bacterium]